MPDMNAVSRLRRPLLGILVMLALIYGRDVYGYFTASGRVAPEVQAAVAAEPFVNVLLVLDFAPEDFHIKQVQATGTMSGVAGTNVRLRRVRPEGLRELSRQYWIRRIELLK
ncbi:MAG TPA: hypothetical protein VLK85_30850 [Ramlibacter sp.]|nr:hypothetical protein [Ramlibacter sp.]